MRIMIVSPIVTRDFAPEAIEELKRAARPTTEVENCFIDRGTASIECDFEEALAIPDTLAKIVQAEKQGFDAVVINCFADPGMKAARELVSIPVVGPSQVAMHAAATLGHKFSVLTILSRIAPSIEDRCRAYGVLDKLASVRSVDIPVLELDRDRAGMANALIEQGQRAVQMDGANALVFGCTGMAGVAKAVESGLRDRGYEVPVIDPPVLAVKVAEVLVDMGLRHSKRTYPYPPQKLVVGYDGFAS